MAWYRSQFFRNVVHAASGTAIANVLMLVALPFLARTYSPAEFGVFAIYMAVSLILSSMACGKYELAVPIPKADADGWQTLTLAVRISFVVPLLALATVATWKPAALDSLGGWLFLLPLGILFDALSRAFSFWLTRKGHFAWLACARMAQVTTVISVQLTYGRTMGGGEGLVIGFVAGAIVLFVLSGGKVVATRPNSTVTRDSLRQTALRYQQNPKFLMLAHTGATVGSSLPVFFLGAFFGEAVAGVFAVAMRVIDRPAQLIGQAVFQVFYPEASRRYAEQGHCSRLFAKTTRTLCWISLSLLVVVVALAPWGASKLLGEQWRASGVMAQLLAPMLVLQLMHTPVSGLFMIAGKQHVDLLWTFARLGLVVAGLLMGLIWQDALASVLGLSIGSSLAYGIHLYLSYRFAQGERMPAGRPPMSHKSGLAPLEAA